MEPTGLWAWINQYAIPPYDQILFRAQAVRGIILKWGMLEIRHLLQSAGIPWAVEAYIYPHAATLWGERLAQWYNDGAQFVVVNAEIEWSAPGSGEAMEAFCLSLNAHSRRGRPLPLYASVDTRGNRMHYPYQQILAENIKGWMPMIYPKAFQQTPARAFVACLESGQDFKGLPVYPTLQTYDHIGPKAVTQQLTEVHNRTLPGCQAYTLGHATKEEWEAFAMDWFDEVITGFGGPVQYRVLVGGAPEYPTEWRTLTHRQWMQLQEWGLIIEETVTERSAVPPHSHRGVVIVNS